MRRGPGSTCERALPRRHGRPRAARGRVAPARRPRTARRRAVAGTTVGTASRPRRQPVAASVRVSHRRRRALGAGRPRVHVDTWRRRRDRQRRAQRRPTRPRGHRPHRGSPAARRGAARLAGAGQSAGRRERCPRWLGRLARRPGALPRQRHGGRPVDRRQSRRRWQCHRAAGVAQCVARNQRHRDGRPGERRDAGRRCRTARHLRGRRRAARRARREAALARRAACRRRAGGAGAAQRCAAVQRRCARRTAGDRWKTGAGEGLARGGRYPGVLELDATLTQGVAARTARYLPLGLPEGARRYVQHAVRDGNLARASFRVRGDLRDFPFVQARRASSASPWLSTA